MKLATAVRERDRHLRTILSDGIALIQRLAIGGHESRNLLKGKLLGEVFLLVGLAQLELRGLFNQMMANRNAYLRNNIELHSGVLRRDLNGERTRVLGESVELLPREGSAGGKHTAAIVDTWKVGSA